jgi:hypothetical protein
VDNAHGVITAVETTPGSIAENKKLLPLVEPHRQNTGKAVAAAVADHKYGTAENYVACQQQKITTHMGDARSRQNHARSKGIFPDSAFVYDAASNTYRCPAGQTMQPRRLHGEKRTWEYHLPKAVCAACALRSQCTRAKVYGRTIHRHEAQELLDQARAQAHSAAGKRDRRRRQHLIEGSFADATNNHGFKRSRWRRLWRQQIQDWLIASIQNVRILITRKVKKPSAAMAANVIEVDFTKAVAKPVGSTGRQSTSVCRVRRVWRVRGVRRGRWRQKSFRKTYRVEPVIGLLFRQHALRDVTPMPARLFRQHALKGVLPK